MPGNGDDARNFDFPPNVGGPSVYESLRAAGYRDCELFGVNWLSAEHRLKPLLNYHDATKAQIVVDFINDVMKFTGQPQVDLIGHSMGATLGLQAVEFGSLERAIRRVIVIAGPLRGLAMCPVVGYANPSFTVCGAQNYFSANIFGLYPPSLFVWNPNMGSNGLRAAPQRMPSTRFYAIGADINDEFLCQSAGFTADCGKSTYFEPASNVLSQLDVGYGSTALEVDYDLSDYSIFKAGGGDLDGVGHYRAKNNTGALQVNMLKSDCRGADCCAGYSPVCDRAQ